MNGVRPVPFCPPGFRAAREFGLSDEFRGSSHFQAIELTPGGLPRDAGLVRYANEFAMLG